MGHGTQVRYGRTGPRTRRHPGGQAARPDQHVGAPHRPGLPARTDRRTAANGVPAGQTSQRASTLSADRERHCWTLATRRILPCARGGNTNTWRLRASNSTARAFAHHKVGVRRLQKGRSDQHGPEQPQADQPATSSHAGQRACGVRSVPVANGANVRAHNSNAVRQSAVTKETHTSKTVEDQMASHTQGIGLSTAENIVAILLAIPKSNGTYADIARLAAEHGANVSRHTVSR